MALEGRVILQPDWESIAANERPEKIWSIFENAAGTRTHSSLVLNDYLNAKAQKEFSANDLNACFERKSTGSVDVTCKWGDGSVLVERFVSPSKQFLNIHASDAKYIRGMDVTSGGLGISCCSDDNLCVWDNATGEVRRKLSGHFGEIYSCRFFPSGVVALSAGADLTIKIWDAATGVCAATLVGHAGAVNETSILERGRNVLSCSRDGTIRFWDVSTQQPVHIYELAPLEFALNYPLNSMCLADCPPNCDTPSGKVVVAACESGRLVACLLQEEVRHQKLFDLKLTAAANCCTSLEGLAPFHVVCGTQDGQIYAVDMRRPELPVAHLDCRSRGAILSLQVIDGRLWATSSDGSAFSCGNHFFTKLGADSTAIKQGSVVELTGSDCEPVTRLASDGRSIFTSCRDGVIRKYLLNSNF